MNTSIYNENQNDKQYKIYIKMYNNLGLEDEEEKISYYDKIDTCEKLNILYELCRGVPGALRQVCANGKMIKFENNDILYVHKHILPNLGDNYIDKYNYFNERCQEYTERNMFLLKDTYDNAHKRCTLKIINYFKNILATRMITNLKRNNRPYKTLHNTIIN